MIRISGKRAIRISGTRIATGRDSIDIAELGIGKHHDGKPKDHPGRFRVTLRFSDLNEAKAELEKARALLNSVTKPDPVTGLYETFVDIAARPTSDANTKQHPMNPYAQICVVW